MTSVLIKGQPTYHDELLRAVVSVVHTRNILEGNLSYNVNNGASMSNFVDDVHDEYTELIGHDIVLLSSIDEAVASAIADKLLSVNGRGWVVLNRRSYRVLGLKPPFWLWK